MMRDPRPAGTTPGPSSTRHSSEPPTVVHIWKDLQTYYGVHDQLLTLARHLRRDRFTLRLCVFGPMDSALKASFEQSSMRVVSLGLRSAWDPRLLFRLIAFLKSCRPGVVQTYCLKANIVGTVAARLAGVPVVIPTELTRRDQAGTALKFMRDICLYPIVRLVYALSDGVVFVSDHVKHEWVGSQPSPKYRTIYSPFNDAKFRTLRIRYRPKPTAGGKTIGIVARLSPEKGHEDLLAAMPRIVGSFSQLRLLIVGTGPYESILKRRTTQLDLSDRVEFLGHREDVAAQLEKMDVFVHPSRSEGMGIAIVEAMVCGLPVVATNHGGIPEVITDGTTGILVPPRAPDRIADAVIALLSDPQRCKVLGRTARRAALDRFHPRVFTMHHEKLYGELLSRKTPLDRRADPEQTDKEAKNGDPAFGGVAGRCGDAAGGPVYRSRSSLAPEENNR